MDCRLWIGLKAGLFAVIDSITSLHVIHKMVM